MWLECGRADQRLGSAIEPDLPANAIAIKADLGAVQLQFYLAPFDARLRHRNSNRTRIRRREDMQEDVFCLRR